MRLADVLRASVERYGPRPAVTDTRTGQSLTYAELGRESARVAGFAAEHGVERAQRIGLAAANDPAHLAAAFGLLAAGACIVPVAGHLRAAEVEQLARDIELNGCFRSPTTDVPGLAEDASATLSAGICRGFRLAWVDRARTGPSAFAALDPAFVRFTSGTTAASKGVVLSHDATLARVEAADGVLRFGPDDRIAWVLPLAYHFAVTIVAYVRAGAHILLCPDTLPGAIVEAIERHRATVLYASPAHVERIAGLEPRGRLDSLRLALSTSAPISGRAIERFESACGIPLGQAYGIIEAGLPCINPGGAGIAPTSVGRTVPGYDVAIFDDAGHRSSAGVTGEIGLRGAGLFSAYYAPWRPIEEIVRDGWFMTGDVGRFDEAGALHLVGRKKAVIFVGGLKFFPEEVEACIDAFPGVDESRVFGRAHPRLGEIPCADVVSRVPLDVGALRAHCARLLSSWKVPVEIAQVDAIPKTAGGKILRRPVEDAEARESGRSGAHSRRAAVPPAE